MRDSAVEVLTVLDYRERGLRRYSQIRASGDGLTMEPCLRTPRSCSGMRFPFLPTLALP